MMHANSFPVRRVRRAVLVRGGLLAASGAGWAQDGKLPASLTMTAYDTGSSGFNMAVAVGKMMKDKSGVDLRVLPGGNDIARLARSREFELRSAFRPTYNMAANLVNRYEEQQAHRLLASSFAQFQTDRAAVAQTIAASTALVTCIPVAF